MMANHNSIFNKIMDYCVNTPRENRSKRVNEFLYNHFQSFPYFKELLEEHTLYGSLMYVSIIKYLTIKKIPKGEPIWKFGETVSSIFIIISGQVNYYRPPPKYKKKMDGDTPGMQKIKMLFKFLFSSTLNKMLDHVVNKGYALGVDQLYKYRRRPQTVEAKTDCIVGELSITDYKFIFERTEVLEKTSISYFIEGLTPFQGSKKSLRKKFQGILTKKHFKKGDLVIKKGDPFKTFYIIREGSFQLSLTTTTTFFNNFDCSFFSKDAELERFSTVRQFELKDEYEEENEYKLVNLGKGELFGEIEYKFGLKKYFFNVKCESDGSEVLEVNLEKFKEITQGKAFLQKFDDEINKQISFIQKRILQIRSVKQKKGNRNKYISTIIQKLDKGDETIKEKTPKTASPKMRRVCKFGGEKYNGVRYKLCTNNIAKIRLDTPTGRKRVVSSYRSKQVPELLDVPSNNYGFPHTERKKRMNSSTFSPLSHLKTSSTHVNSEVLSNNYQTVNAPKIRQFNCGFIPFKPYQSQSRKKEKREEILSINPLFSPQSERKSIKKFGDTRILTENNKSQYSKCFEVNKTFFLKNNTSILSKKLSSIFMSNQSNN